MQGRLQGNLDALGRRQPALSERLRTHRRTARIEILEARSGDVTIRLDGRLEASAVDPREEAQRFADEVRHRANEVGAQRIVLLGIGVYSLPALTDIKAPILVVEPSLDLVRAVFETVDLRDALEHVELVAGDELGAALGHPLFRGSERGIILFHTATRRRNPDFLDALVQRFHPGGDPSPLDIAVIPPLFGGSLPVADACSRALRQLGHRVRYPDLSPFLPAYQEIGRATSGDLLEPFSAPLRSGLVRLIGQTILAGFQIDPPDLVFAMAQAPLDLEMLDSLRRQGITRAFWFCEDFHVMPYWKALAPHFDVFFHIQPEDFSKPLRDAGGNGVPLPMAFDPQIHCPVDLREEDRRRYGSDLSFVGAGYYNRIQCLPSLFSMGLRIWGTEWPITPEFLDVMPEPNVRQSSETSNLIFNATHINLNLHSSPWCDSVNPVGDFVNPRTFELAGAGGFQLVDERRDLGQFFVPGREVVTFRDLTECREKISYYLSHPEERLEIAARARSRALGEHTYRHRMETALDLLRSGSIPLAPRRRTQITVGDTIDQSSDEPELREILGRVPRDDAMDYRAVSLAVGRGSGELSREEKLLLFMREARAEVEIHSSSEASA